VVSMINIFDMELTGEEYLEKVQARELANFG
jgi:hypothetical protein